MVFFLHAEALRQVVQQTYKIRTTTLQRYSSFVKFEVDIHNINLFPVKGPPPQIHQARFVVIDDDFNAIVNL